MNNFPVCWARTAGRVFGAFGVLLALANCGGAKPEPTSPPVARATASPPPVAPTVRPAATATAQPTQPPTPIPVQLEFSRYVAYQVQAGDTLASIAQRGGTAPIILSIYNRLAGEPQPGRNLIVPEVKGNTSVLSSSSVLVLKGSTSQPWVALTLDAGASSAPTAGMLDTLKAADARITFFLTGAWIDENPELTRRIVADGHELANHSYSHSDFTTLSDAEIAAELQRTEDSLHRAVGPDVSMRPFFRPPFGAYDERVLNAVIANGYLPIYWTFDSLDSVGEPKTAEFLTKRITGHLPLADMPGAIILAHCGSEPTAEALPAILQTFADQGLAVRPLSAVLGP